MKNLFTKLILLFLFTLSSYADIACTGTTANCTYDVSAATLASKIEGIGITITNAKITHGDGKQVGVFSNGINGAGLEIDEGIILTGMNVKESFTTNSSWRTSIQESDIYSDTDLIAIASDAIYNPVIFEFDVTLDANTRLLLIDYQFASEEYNEYVGSQFNDAFGFFVSGGDLPQTYNIARVIDNQTYVTINNIDNYQTVTVNNVNNGSVGIYDDSTAENLTNTSFFIDNCKKGTGVPNCTQNNPPVDVEYDGITHILHATLDNLTPGQTYHFKMAIADTGDSAWDTGVFVNKITGLREPSLCYDYAYKQDDVYLTEGYDPNKGPYISAESLSSNPIQVGMYIKNTQESEIEATNITIDIIDINTTQASYISNSTYVTEPGSFYPAHISDSFLTLGTDYINGVPITSFNAFEYFYIYFFLTPHVSDMSLPIVARINYDLTVPLSATQTQTIYRSSIIDEDVPICSGSSDFDPVYGLFNVIENGLYTSDSSYYYNLNTQVVNRQGNLSVATVDANSSDLHDLIPATTIVGVDIVDLNSFHDTAATCSDVNNTISDRVWVLFDNQSLTPLNVSGFNQKASKNAAFRISYFDDGNGTLLQLEKVEKDGETRWNVKNFPTLVKNGQCMADIASGTDTVAQYCSNAGSSFASAMTWSDLQTCMDCVYGYNTYSVCSRDNFSIRPEAFQVHLSDQNLSGGPQLNLLTQNFTGVTNPSTNRHIDLASGYTYQLDVNATNHIDNNASSGYNAQYSNASASLTDANVAVSRYVWTPQNGQDVSGCNDLTDKDVNLTINSGIDIADTSVAQVGDYIFSMVDSSWTAIDRIEQSHHYSSSYFQSGSDCVVGSSFVASTSAYDNLNGCNISSTHINQDTFVTYHDLNVTFHPYQFNLSNTLSVGDSNKTDSDMTDTRDLFVYMANIDQNESISVHLDTTVTAASFSGTALSNYVANCFSRPLHITIDKSDTTSVDLAYQYLVHNLDSNSSTLTTFDINSTIAKGHTTENADFNTTAAFFQKDQNGTMRLRTNLNFNRDINVSAGPEDINYSFIAAEDNATLFNADLVNNKFAEGNRTVGQVVHHYYGKTVAPKVTIICNELPCTTGTATSSDTSTKVLAYFTIYCDPTDAAYTCQAATVATSATLPINSFQTNDIRWWTNPYHDDPTASGVNISGTQTNDGDIGAISEVANSQVNASALVEQEPYMYELPLTYQGGNGLPYDATMQMQSDPWLIYNASNGNATANSFIVEFIGASGWSGIFEEDSTTDTKGVAPKNRRIMW
ncbi:choice-of-anchor L domain-containing protein [Sulfurimonas sp.]|uniref:choice-of-anchor L domain-containing protein n=1 Tax=Sulfurimonas sp. TaxID=2022749 RepID=UPI003D0C8862